MAFWCVAFLVGSPKRDKGVVYTIAINHHFFPVPMAADSKVRCETVARQHRKPIAVYVRVMVGHGRIRGLAHITLRCVQLSGLH